MTGGSDRPVVRPAVAADAAALGHCHVACWREAYSGLVHPDRLAEVLADVDGRVAGWRRVLAGSRATQLAEHQGEVIGFAAAGPAAEPGLDLTTKLYALYVRQAWGGTGVGHRLLEAALGDEDAYLWVFRDNERARRSYVRHGFVPDGTEKVDDYFGGVEIRMVRRRGRPDRGADAAGVV